MNPLRNNLSGPVPESFVTSHCSNCSAGWTRTKKDGGVLTVCLLDRELVSTEISGCDRYEARKPE
jgi:hypothetical protein